MQLSDRLLGLAKARPAKVGFCILGGLLLGGRPALFDQLQECLAAVARPLAFLDLVEHRHRCTRQLEQYLFATSSPPAARRRWR
jgi:hypothetical protein